MKISFGNKGLFLILALMVSLCFNGKTVLAQTAQSGNVTAEMKVEAVNENRASVSITVKNNGAEPVNNLHISGAAPEGMKILAGNAAEKKVEQLESQGTSTIQYSIETKAASSQPGADDNTDKKSQGEKDSVNTGDSNSLFYFLLGICLFAAGAIVLIKTKVLKNILSIFLCGSMILALFIPANVAKAADMKHMQFTVSEKITLKGTEYLVAAEISYDTPEASIPSGEVVTRAQWVDELITAMGYENQIVVLDNVQLPYSDIAGHENKNEILIAYNNSFLEKDESKIFRPDEAATREFAAATAVWALAFQTVKDIECVDSADVNYKQEAETAIAMNIMQLEDGKFNPSRPLTRSEADSAIDGVTAVLNSESIDEGYDNKIIFEDSVEVLPDEADYDVNGTTVTVTPATAAGNLKIGDIFVLPDKTPYKVVSINKIGNSSVIEVSVPKIEETLSNIDAQGYGAIDMNGFIPAEGVSLEGAIESRANLTDIEGTIGGPGDIKFELNKEIGPGKLTGSFSISVPRILYKADVDIGWTGFDVKNVYLKVPSTIKIDGGYKIDGDSNIGKPKDTLIELGKVPVAGIPGMAVYVQLGIKISAEGKIQAVFNVDGTAGVQVLNNRLRIVKDLNTSFQLPELEASMQLGPELAGLLEICNTWDLIDFSVSAGAALKATLAVRNPSLTCVDTNGYMYGEISAMDKGIIGDWLDIGYKWSFWDEKNSPIRAAWHFENLKRTEPCTFGAGTLRGAVAKAADRTAPIKDAEIVLYNKGNTEEVKKLKTDEKGNYQAALPQGDYIAVISADGYMSFEYEATVVQGEEKYVETFLMVDEGQPGVRGVAEGIITDALTGSVVEGASITFRNGWNKITGDSLEIVQTDASGKYQVQLPIGNYTAHIQKAGYVSNTLNIVVLPISLFPQNAALVPTGEVLPEGELRIVLTWGEQPEDLDSHLIGPDVSGDGYFHTYFSNKDYYVDSVKYANLDLDDVSSFGPETTTVYQMNESGTYSFYVHDYTNQWNSQSAEMSMSGASVKVYKGGQLCATYPVPTGKEGVYWHVFDYNAGSNTIIPINTFPEDIEYQSEENARVFAVPVPFEMNK